MEVIVLTFVLLSAKTSLCLKSRLNKYSDMIFYLISAMHKVIILQLILELVTFCKFNYHFDIPLFPND